MWSSVLLYLKTLAEPKTKKKNKKKNKKKLEAEKNKTFIGHTLIIFLIAPLSRIQHNLTLLTVYIVS